MKRLETRVIRSKSLQDLAADWGVDLQVVKIKTFLINLIRIHCTKKNISEKDLASMVPGLTKEKVSKILSGQVGHITIDKLIEITSVLKYEITIKAKAT